MEKYFVYLFGCCEEGGSRQSRGTNCVLQSRFCSQLNLTDRQGGLSQFGVAAQMLEPVGSSALHRPLRPTSWGQPTRRVAV